MLCLWKIKLSDRRCSAWNDKKVPDGQATGCALVSYNESVFLSYGLKEI